MNRCKNILLILLSLAGLFSCKNASFQDKINQTHEILENVLNERQNQLIDYMNETRHLVLKLSNDELIASFFKAKRAYYFLSKKKKLPQQVVNEIEKLKKNLQYYYLQNYQQFSPL